MNAPAGPSSVEGVKVLTVNLAHRHSNRGKSVPSTGIDKRPVDWPVEVAEPGPKGTGAVGLAGDRVYDHRHHGGTYQAVYAYAREDLDYWAAQFGHPLANGVFGENLTTIGLEVNQALIGERWRIGADVVLEVTSPRIPCSTFQGWLKRRGWIKRFTQAVRPGSYLRVVEPGRVQAGDPVEVVSRPEHDVTVALTFRALTTEPELLPRLLVATALPPQDLAVIRRRVAA